MWEKLNFEFEVSQISLEQSYGVITLNPLKTDYLLLVYLSEGLTTSLWRIPSIIFNSLSYFNALWFQVAIEVPYIFAQTLLYGVIVYAMINFEWTAAKFFWYLFFMYFTLLYFTFYGMMAVGMTPNHEIAAIVSALFYAIWNLFAGFLIPRPVSSNPILHTF